MKISKTLAILSYIFFAFVLSANASVDKVCSSPVWAGLNSVQSFLFISVSGGTSLDGNYNGWCANLNVPAIETSHTDLVLTKDSILDSIDIPQNLDEATWVLNQSLIGYTSGDIQIVLWKLLNGYYTTDYVGPHDINRVNILYNNSLVNGSGFVPQPGQKDILILYPISAACDFDSQNTGLIAQPMIITVVVPPVEPPIISPGTGTPGYWKTHPEAWPVTNLTIGNTIYTKSQLLVWLNKNVSGDKRITMMKNLICAKLNVIIGNESNCIDSAIIAADEWWILYGNRKVSGSSYAWNVGEFIANELDNYNNGLLCAPHRD